jgi:hypothetical protein
MFMARVGTKFAPRHALHLQLVDGGSGGNLRGFLAAGLLLQY